MIRTGPGLKTNFISEHCLLVLPSPKIGSTNERQQPKFQLRFCTLFENIYQKILELNSLKQKTMLTCLLKRVFR